MELKFLIELTLTKYKTPENVFENISLLVY